jgi:hypothetical protein
MLRNSGGNDNQFIVVVVVVEEICWCFGCKMRKVVQDGDVRIRQQLP